MDTSDSGTFGAIDQDASLCLPEPDLEAGRLWYAIQTKSRQEKALAQHMDGMGITAFLPLVSKVRTYGKRQKRSELPLFPGYVFLCGQKAEVYEADRTRHVARCIEVPDQDGFYRELEAIHRVSRAGQQLDPYPTLTEGVRVEVRAGPFKGVQGVVKGRTREVTRLFLAIQTLGQSAVLEIDGSLLEPI